MAPTCSNCGGHEFVWASELRTGGRLAGGALSLRAGGELPLGTRICLGCGHADLFLRDVSILRMPHHWRPGEFVRIHPPPSAPAASPPARAAPPPVPTASVEGSAAAPPTPAPRAPIPLAEPPTAPPTVPATEAPPVEPAPYRVEEPVPLVTPIPDEPAPSAPREPYHGPAGAGTIYVDAAGAPPPVEEMETPEPKDEAPVAPTASRSAAKRTAARRRPVRGRKAAD